VLEALERLTTSNNAFHYGESCVNVTATNSIWVNHDTLSSGTPRAIRLMCLAKQGSNRIRVVNVMGTHT
jgi:hypothetical protein